MTRSIKLASSSSNVLQTFRKKCRLSNDCPRFSTAVAAALTSNDETCILEENKHFPNLFKPLDLGPAIGSLPNRVLMGSMHTGLEVCLLLYDY